jgi:hypothetical protein
MFTLISRGEPALELTNVIGVFLGQKIMQGANFGTAVDEKVFLKRLVTIYDYPAVEKWFKVDIRIDWATKLYKVLLDDAIMAKDMPFDADDIDGIRLSVMRACDVWYDEIYVGFDNSMNFECPVTSRDKGTVTMTPEQKHWSLDELRGEGDPFTTYTEMTRHYSHLETVGSVSFDGRGAITQNQDIKFSYPTGE